MNELELVVPNGNVEILNETLRKIRKHTSDAEARINSNAATITKDNYRKEKLNAFDDEDDLLKESAEKLVDVVATQTHIKELLVEIGASRNRIKAALKERQAIIRNLKKQYDLPDPTHTYAVQFDVTDVGFKKIMECVRKYCDEEAYRMWKVEGDDARLAADTFFNAIGWNK